MSYLMKKKEECKEGKYNLRSNPGLISPFVSLPNSHTSSCSPGHITLLAWYDGCIILQEFISTASLVAATATGKDVLGILL